MKRPILIHPDPRLKKVCDPVSDVSDQLRALAEDMLETMYDAPGIGLAAPQVGVKERLLVMDVADKTEEPRPLKLINPEIVWESEEVQSYNEGCLSLPEQYADIVRPAAVKVRYLDETGSVREMEATELTAVCVQHEIDHLDGVLFVDHLSALKRNTILRKMAKWKKAQGAA